MGTDAVEPIRVVTGVLAEAAGGFAFGLAAAWLVVRAMDSIDDFAVEVSMTIALVMTVYSIALMLHLSGAIAIVGAGMVFGGDRARRAMSDETEEYVRRFWTLVDEILNTLLFLMLGVELPVVPFHAGQFWLIAGVVLLVFLARFAMVLPCGAYLWLLASHACTATGCSVMGAAGRAFTSAARRHRRTEAWAFRAANPVRR